METPVRLGASQGLAKLQVADGADKGSRDRISAVLTMQRQFQEQLQLSKALSARLDMMATQAVGMQAVIKAALAKLRTSKPAREGSDSASKRKNVQTASQMRTAACSSQPQVLMGCAEVKPINQPFPRSDGLASPLIGGAAALHGLLLSPSAPPVGNMPCSPVEELQPSSYSSSLPASSSPRRLLSSATPEIGLPASATSSQHDLSPAGSPAPASPPAIDVSALTGKRVRAEVDTLLKLPSLSPPAADSYSPCSQENEYSAGFAACANQQVVGCAAKRLRVANDRNALGARAKGNQSSQQPEGKLKKKSKEGQQQKQQDKATARSPFGGQQGRNVGLQEPAEATLAAPTALHCPLVFKPSYFSNPYVIQQLQQQGHLREAETSIGTAAPPNTTPMARAICPNDQLAQGFDDVKLRMSDDQAGHFALPRPLPSTRGSLPGVSCTLDPAYAISAYAGQWQHQHQRLQPQPICGLPQAHSGRLQPVCLYGSGRIVVAPAEEGPRPWPQGAVTPAALTSASPALSGYMVAVAGPYQSVDMAPQQRPSGYDATCYVEQLPASCFIDDDVEAVTAVQGLGLL